MLPPASLEHDALTLDRPLARDGPVVQAQTLARFVGWRELAGAAVAEIRLRRPQVVPVGLGLHAESLDRDELALDAEQTLDHALRFLVTPFAEALVADDAVGVDEIERRPVVVVERAPDLVVVVGSDRVVDLSLLVACRTPSISCSKENSGVWTPITTSPSSR